VFNLYSYEFVVNVHNLEHDVRIVSYTVSITVRDFEFK